MTNLANQMTADFGRTLITNALILDQRKYKVGGRGMPTNTNDRVQKNGGHDIYMYPQMNLLDQQTADCRKAEHLILVSGDSEHTYISWDNK